MVLKRVKAALKPGNHPEMTTDFEVLTTPKEGGVSPYKGKRPEAYWKSGVAERAPLDPGRIYRAKFAITRQQKIMTAGSCFAQHVGRHLRQAQFDVIDEEPLPEGFLDNDGVAFGFRQYSARYGNIYTARQLAQILGEAFGEVRPAVPVWEKRGSYYDAQRPGIEPVGHDTPETVMRLRAAHLGAVRRAVEAADVFVFTFGLTEAWQHSASGTVYPTAPGTIAGHYDPEHFSFVNFSYDEVREDFLKARAILQRHRPNIRFMITVSPVPLTATGTEDHVEVATCYSKSTLRSVCGHLSRTYEDIDYFPSYEIITSQAARGTYYMPNLRSVSDRGVGTAMATFMAAHNVAPPRAQPKAGSKTADVACEEALLEAFAK